MTVVDTLGCESTSEPYEVTVENCVGITEHSDQRHLTLFPNPCVDVLNINYEGAATISIRNLLGQYIMSVKHFKNDVSLNISGLDSGLYFAEIHAEGKSFTRKFIKK